MFKVPGSKKFTFIFIVGVVAVSTQYIAQHTILAYLKRAKIVSCQVNLIYVFGCLSESKVLKNALYKLT